MGIPSFYRWLVNKYPKIVSRTCNRDKSLPSPNRIEFDNLYLDINCIIYPCIHSDDSTVQTCSFEDVFSSMYEYIDNLFTIVRPKQLLYMAIDGVAPRAKMNHQRSRRFMAAKEAEIDEERLRLQFASEDKPFLPKLKSKISDRCISSPGTVFIHELSKALKIFIRARIQNDPRWKDLKVILSDANVPGEGGHKIITFIRNQRNHPGYNPNTRHCIYGLDAELILLALASHELHISILREGQQSPTESGLAATSNSMLAEVTSKTCGWSNMRNISKPYEFVDVWILREYLEFDMRIDDPMDTFEIDIERVIDDFIVICFFTGNDFLPCMPSLKIYEGAIDLMMKVYKQQFKSLGGYLVDMEQVAKKMTDFINLERVEKFILMVGTYEENIFKKRSSLLERNVKRFERRSRRDSVTVSQDLPLNCSEKSATYQCTNEETVENSKHLTFRKEKCLRMKPDQFEIGGLMTDKVRLGSPGWKERYYKEKFSVETPKDVENMRKKLVEKYIEGLVWILHYYFSGVPSWSWYSPFYYCPFASDISGLPQIKINFEKGYPFKPFDQLLCVLHPSSVHALPGPYKHLMTEAQSNIIDFYPKEFEIDTNGKNFMWQAICKLPFIDELRLLTETRKFEKELGEEAVRNVINDDLLFVNKTNMLGSQIMKLNQNKPSAKIDNSLSDGFNGCISYLNEESGIMKSNTSTHDQTNSVLCVVYANPNCGSHLPLLCASIEYPPKTICEDDILETSLWHEIPCIRPPITRHFNDYRRPNTQDSERNWSSSNSSWSYKGAHGVIADLKISEPIEYFRSSRNSHSYYNSSLGSSDSSNWRSQNGPANSSYGSQKENKGIVCMMCGKHDSNEKMSMTLLGTDILARIRIPFFAYEKGCFAGLDIRAPCIVDGTRGDYYAKKLQSYVEEKSFSVSEIYGTFDRRTFQN